MGQAKDIIENIMRNKNYYADWGLAYPEKDREWKAFNMLAGENGAGKSRVLQMIKSNVPKDCIVFYLDFANGIQTMKVQTGLDNTEENALAYALIFNEGVENETSGDFLKNLSNEMLAIFAALSDMENDSRGQYKKRAKKILSELEASVNDILHRKIAVREEGIYLCKENREVPIASEWDILSPGERSILLVILSVLFIKMEKNPCILLIDELETHLHPDAQVKLYKFLKQELEASGADYCTCIASHSIFLLPLFTIHEIVYMSNGKTGQINGGLYQQVYDNLTGEGDKKEESLTDFLYSMDAWQYADYLAQCFLEPITVDEVKSTDEQALQFAEVLKNLRTQKEIIEVLDFGAGTSRIGRCMELMERDDISIQKLTATVKYHVYDKHGISNEVREGTVWKGSTYLSKEEIISSGKKFDLILLYNVLHEISIDEWVQELCLILDLLAEGGFLVFGEREILTLGEKPYGKSGYLVLGRDELLKLFPEAEIKEIILPEKQRAVTVCFLVKKPPAKENYPDRECVKAALHSLRDNTKNKIRNREKNGLGERGKSRKYAFYCQQYVNAEEAIELLEEMEKKEIEKKEIEKKEIEKKENEYQANEAPSGITGGNATLEDIINAPISKKEKMKIIEEWSHSDTIEGKKCKKYLETQ